MNSPDQSSKRRNLAAVAIIINDNGEVLLTRRNQPTSYAHRKWQFAGGGIEHGEHPVDALKREIKEEVGDIQVEVISETPFLYSHFSSEADVHVIVLGFPVKYVAGKIDISKDEETGDAKWFKWEEVQKLDSLPGTKELVEKALTYL